MGYRRRPAEEGNAMAAIADKPVEVTHFVKHCDQRRKYPVLLRVEFQVSSHHDPVKIHYQTYMTSLKE